LKERFWDFAILNFCFMKYYILDGMVEHNLLVVLIMYVIWVWIFTSMSLCFQHLKDQLSLLCNFKNMFSFCTRFVMRVANWTYMELDSCSNTISMGFFLNHPLRSWSLLGVWFQGDEMRIAFWNVGMGMLFIINLWWIGSNWQLQQWLTIWFMEDAK
jgi:hypothetical protein